ncbi:MAG: FHA domain-containing protein [Nocardia sp.]|nr:FHA domain-containing protein [Nocardia sp.]
MGASCLGFGLLGPVLMTVAGTPVALGTPKQRAVMAVLLINRNHPVGTESLINAAWNGSPAPAARASIHSYISNLRRLLSDAGADPRTALAAVAPGYRLRVADGECDVDRFISAKTAGFQASAAGHFEQAGNHLSAALTQWRGQVLDDLRDFAFVDAFATALTEDHLLVRTARAEAEIACGRADAVVAELEALIRDHPYREPLWAQLITAYYVAGRQSDALAVYRRLQAVLAEDLGIDPSPQLCALHARILRQERLDVERAARTRAAVTIASTHTAFDRRSAIAGLRDAGGQRYPLQPAATRIGRQPDNDIVLDDADISRHHAVIIDTGSSFVITDMRSANGVFVENRRLRPSATLADGHHIRICGHEFTVEIEQG